MSNPHYIAVLDFEATCNSVDGKKDHSFGPLEIIEFPTVLIDTTLPGFPVVAEFREYVKPVKNRVLTEFCTGLTGITQDQVDAADPFPQVLQRYSQFVTDHGLTTENCLVVTCGDWDLKTMLPAQMRILAAGAVAAPELLSRWNNVKKSFSRHMGASSQDMKAGMAGMLRMMGLELEGRHHSGLDDCRNISKIVRQMLEEGFLFSVNGGAGAPKSPPRTPATLSNPKPNEKINGNDKSSSSPSSSNSSLKPWGPKPGSTAPTFAAAASSTASTVADGTTTKSPAPRPAPAPCGSKSKSKTKPFPPLPSYGPLVDIGVNLTHHSFPAASLLDILRRCRREANVTHLVLTGTSLKSSMESVALCERLNATNDPDIPHLSCTVGVHPHDATEARKREDIDQRLRGLIKQGARVVVAVGEAGLDFDRNFSTPEDQEFMFRLQVPIALDLDLPLFMHERAAIDRFCAVVEDVIRERGKNEMARGVLHCFTGETVEHLERVLAMGFSVGITGWVTDMRPGRGEGLMKLVKHVPMDKLMIETDAPFLTPRNVKPAPRVNDPCLVGFVAKAVAEAYGGNVTPEEVARMTTANAVAMFRLPAHGQ
ncbi:hypothetical protein HK101_012013 [Irineochytrium annulatum]|nr:hypothetical protein HK101_012013 [Irineochytrium annulatum]